MLLNATLLLFAAYAFIIGHSWKDALQEQHMTTQANVVSVGAAVEETETNILVSQLDDRARELDAREAALTRQAPAPSTDTRTLALITVIGTGLLGLILLNFYLDHRRRMSLA